MNAKLAAFYGIKGPTGDHSSASSSIPPSTPAF